MPSTQHNDDIAQVGVRAEGGRKLKDKPVCVENYNQKMGGVDLNDQMMNYHPFERKSIKWWKKLFFHIFSIALVNSHILLNEIRTQKNEPKMRLKKFLQQLTLDLVDKVGVRLNSEPTPVNVNRLTARHFASHIPPTEKKQHPQRACKVCADKEKLSEKSWHIC